MLADCIDNVIHAKGNYNELRDTGPEQAARFSWETAGRLTTRTYARALGLPDVQEQMDNK